MQRYEIIERIGKEYHSCNMENGEFSYQKAANLAMTPKRIDGHKFRDLRFVKDDVSVLVETKQKFSKKDENQLFAYVELEKQFGNPKIIAILANIVNTKIKVWQNSELLEIETKIRTMSEYVDFFDESKINNKQKVVMATYRLNEVLHTYGIKESVRGQFVGTCLLALKNNLKYENLSTGQILAGIKEILKDLLKDASDGMKKAGKLDILDEKVLGEQNVKGLDKKVFWQILDFIKCNLLPYINEKTNQGQDLLNLFFTTFNKYVGKSDKNQAFTPDHIAHFMCRVARINKNSIVLDPTCGSGAFLVHAMIQAMENCTKSEADNIKRNQIFGVEFEEKAFGLVTTNMLIHGDGNSNVYNDSCFDRLSSFKNKGINVVLMNPPYNATKEAVPVGFSKTWTKNKKTDPTKGFYYVYETAKSVKHNNGILLCLLPLACAIGSDSIIAEYKEKMLSEHTLDAVFTLPSDVFYPGASASVCCMVFKLNQPHPQDHPTFFGYYKDDGFLKKKNLGRVDIKNQWDATEKNWLNLYRNRIRKDGMSALKNVTASDEWLAEAYMKTDYALLTEDDFKKTIRNYLSYKIGNNEKYEFVVKNEQKQKKGLNKDSWREFCIEKIFECDTTAHLIETVSGDTNYVSRSALNNGVSKLVCDDDYEPNSANCITIGAEGMYAFYQDKPFVAGVKIYTLRHDSLNQYNAMFLCAVLNKEVYRYNYGRARILDKIKKETISLPAQKDKTGKYVPDFRFMEDYIKSLPYGDLI